MSVTSTIKTIHEEEYNDGSRTLGVLINMSEDSNDSFVYIYRKGMYIIFETMIDMLDYLLYGKNDTTCKRAYIDEAQFDTLYDSEFNGMFRDNLKWVN